MNGASPHGKKQAMMRMREALGARHVGGDEAITTRIGAVALPLGFILLLQAKGPRNGEASEQPRVTFDRVIAELRNHHFAVLSTVDEDGTPHAAGVTYGTAYAGRDLVLYVMTRRHLRKARNISSDPRVALVVPIEHRVLRFLPPATIQLHGRAEILDWTDEAGTEVFRSFWLGRRILAAYQASHGRGETRICFLKIVVDPVITTYMVGVSVWELWRRMERGAARVLVPTDQAPPVPVVEHEYVPTARGAATLSRTRACRPVRPAGHPRAC
jgi:general stress protein 26